MKISDKIKRLIAFYFSVALFCTLLPIILSYSLGYQIDYSAFKIYKTGILYINSKPSGASLYVNGRRHKDLTPTQIEELKPGTYRIEVRREGFYPWERDLVVRPNMATKADRIVLFPIAKELEKIGAPDTKDFVISDKGQIYYFSKAGLFRSALDGTGLKRLTLYSDWPDRITGRKISPDGGKLIYFNEHAVSVVYLDPEPSTGKDKEDVKVEEVIKSADPIIDVFWYSASDHLLVVTANDIKAVELRGEGMRNIVALYKFNTRPQSLYYDDDNDSLYFTDTRGSSAPGEVSYLYRLDLRQKFFDQLMQLLLKKEPVEGYEKR